MTNRRAAKSRWFVVSLTLALIGAACGDAAVGESAAETVAEPPAADVAATTQPPATTQAPTTTAAPATTAEAATTTTSTLSDERLAAAAAVGDIAAGEELFHEKVEGVQDNVSCSSCHTLDGKDSQWGPTLTGVAAAAAGRVDGMSDVEYLRQSIVDPYAFEVGGDWALAMPYKYPDALSEDQISNLIAFLLTR